MSEIDRARQSVARARRLVGLTGAGVSTDSGIPDYRGKGGVWSSYRVVTIQDFLAGDDGRREYWRRAADIWSAISKAQPAAGHMFFAQLHAKGKLHGLITQNVDGLHQMAGLPAEALVELHGNGRSSVCLDCGRRMPTADAVKQFRKAESPPRCTGCGGWLKPATVSFGQAMPRAEMARATRLASEADVFMVAGSSLAVQPAAGLPVLARRNGATVIIVNRNETTLDDFADVVIHGELAEVLPGLLP